MEMKESAAVLWNNIKRRQHNGCHKLNIFVNRKKYLHLILI